MTCSRFFPVHSCIQNHVWRTVVSIYGILRTAFVILRYARSGSAGFWSLKEEVISCYALKKKWREINLGYLMLNRLRVVVFLSMGVFWPLAAPWCPLQVTGCRGKMFYYIYLKVKLLSAFLAAASSKCFKDRLSQPKLKGLVKMSWKICVFAGSADLVWIWSDGTSQCPGNTTGLPITASIISIRMRNTFI